MRAQHPFRAQFLDNGFSFSRLPGTQFHEPDSREKIAVRWSAPESIEKRIFTVASDVWSFGILVHEIFSNGEKPYGDWGNAEVWHRVKSGYRLVLAP